MLIDFNSMKEIDVKNMNDGIGKVSAKMHIDSEGKLIISKIKPHSSIGEHLHSTSDDINFVLKGKGIAICDGIKEELLPNTCHICKKGSKHSIINDSDEDLVLLTVVNNR